jgi:hypothetical protein
MSTEDEPRRPPATIRYVTKTGLFAEIIAPDSAWLQEARDRLAELSEDERREAAARYIAARYARTLPARNGHDPAGTGHDGT